MKKILFSLVVFLCFTLYSFSQGLIIKNATPQKMVLTDFVYIDTGCTVPSPNFYGINETLPAYSYTYSAAFHTGNGWKLGIFDNISSWQDLRDETPAGCGSGFVNGVPIGAYNLKWWYEPNGDIFVYIY
jgi:hypothetical protein